MIKEEFRLSDVVRCRKRIQSDAACRDARDVIRCVVSGQESESRERGRKRVRRREIRWYFSSAIGSFGGPEKDPPQLVVAAMDRELIEKFVEVTGKYIVRTSARKN